MASLRLPKMLYRTLGNTGLSVSILGFGASPLGDVFDTTNPAEGKRAVHAAIENGINFFDVSPYYGLTLAEERLGEALNGRRNKIVLATKCGRYGAASFDFSRRRILASIDESLTRLKTDYVDLLQAHDVEFGDTRQIIEETIPALREVQRAGKTRFIGISGLPLRVLRNIAAQQEVDTILSYCRYNLLVTDLKTEMAPFVRARGIGLINASPLHMGLLSGRGAPDWHPASPDVKQVAAEVVAQCQKRGFNPSTVALKFCLAYPEASSTLTGMHTTAEVEANIQALELDLDPKLMEEIERIVAPVKNKLWPSGRPENQDQSNQDPASQDSGWPKPSQMEV